MSLDSLVLDDSRRLIQQASQEELTAFLARDAHDTMGREYESTSGMRRERREFDRGYWDKSNYGTSPGTNLHAY